MPCKICDRPESCYSTTDNGRALYSVSQHFRVGGLDHAAGPQIRCLAPSDARVLCHASVRPRRDTGGTGMAKAKITERVIDTLRTASRRTGKAAFLWDTELRGFGLRVSVNGHGTWLVQKW